MTLETERRRHIIDSTVRVLVRDGTAGTSLSRVASEAKVAKGIICYYFGTKDGLFDAVLSSMRERIVFAAISDAEGVEDCWSRVATFVAAHMAYMREHRGEVLALRHLASTRAGGTEVSDHLSVWREQQQWLVEVFSEGQRLGVFRAFDVQAVATAISGALESGLLRWAHDEAIDLNVYAGQLLDLFQGGVRAELAAEKSRSDGSETRFGPYMNHDAPQTTQIRGHE